MKTEEDRPTVLETAAQEMINSSITTDFDLVEHLKPLKIVNIAKFYLTNNAVNKYDA